MQAIKLVGIFFIFLIVISLILFILGKVNAYVFWMVVIISAVVAYKVLPRLRAK